MYKTRINRKIAWNNRKCRQFLISKSETFEMAQYIITKKIAKHGSQAIIVIPRVLEKQLKPKTVVKVTIDIVEEAP